MAPGAFLFLTHCTTFPFAYAQSIHALGIHSEPLLEKRKNSLVCLICLSQHGCSCLLEDALFRESRHLISHIRIANAGFSRLQVLSGVIIYLHRIFQTVLNRTQFRANGRNTLQHGIYRANDFRASATSRSARNSNRGPRCFTNRHRNSLRIICANVQPLFRIVTIQ